jgi:hypothetical protein
MKTALYDSTKKSRFYRFILIGAAIFVTCLLVTFTGLRIYIKIEAHSIANNAVQVFEKDKIESLIAVIDANNYTLKDKNKAIWALGTLKDERALPKLESLFSGKACNHNSSLCQYEIGKTIHKIKCDYKNSRQRSN